MVRQRPGAARAARRTVARLTAGIMLLTMLIPAGAAAAELNWKTETAGQQVLKLYVENANLALESHGEQPVNSLFEMYQGFAVMGITILDNAETPEGVEITARLFAESINSLEVRVSDVSRFPVIAAAFLQAMSPETMSWEDALKTPKERATKAAASPQNSYEEPMEDLNGTAPRVFYAYYPNQYQDGVNWMQMTIIFPLEGYWDGYGVINNPEQTKAPDTYSGHSADYEGYFSRDDYSHLDVFMTATPEPDSAAAEENAAMFGPP